MIKILNVKLFIKKVSKILFLRVTERLFNFLTFVYLVNKLDPLLFGNFIFCISIINVLSIFSLNGLQSVLIRTVARKKSGLFKTANILSFSSCIFASIIYLTVFLYLFPQEQKWISLSLFITILFYLGFNSWKSYYLGKEYTTKLSFIIFFSNIFTNITLILLAFNNFNKIIYFIFFYLFFQAIINVILTLSVHEKKKSKYFKKEIKFGIKSSIIDFFPNLTKEIDRILIYKFSNPATLVILSIISKVPDAIKEMFRVIIVYSLPNISRINFYSHKIKKYNTYFNVISIITLLVFASTIYPFIFKILFNENYYDYILYSQFLLITLFLANDTIFKNNFFRSQLNLKSYSISIVISSLIKLFTSVSLIYLYDLKGAIISVILNRIINFFLSFYLVKKYHSKINVKYNL